MQRPLGKIRRRQKSAVDPRRTRAVGKAQNERDRDEPAENPLPRTPPHALTYTTHSAKRQDQSWECFFGEVPPLILASTPCSSRSESLCRCVSVRRAAGKGVLGVVLCSDLEALWTEDQRRDGIEKHAFTRSRGEDLAVFQVAAGGRKIRPLTWARIGGNRARRSPNTNLCRAGGASERSPHRRRL